MRRSARHRGSRPVLRGEKVTAVVMASDQTTHRAGEDDPDEAKVFRARDVYLYNGVRFA